MTRRLPSPASRRSRRSLAAPSCASLALVLASGVARADPAPPADPAPAADPARAPEPAPTPAAEPPPAEEVPPGLRGPRFGVTPGIGIGFAGFTGNVAYPSFVFTTAIQLEGLVELARWGLFVRGGFISAGSSGRWTAPTFALGAQYRLVGDGEERWGAVVRAAGLFERWTATPTAGSCDIFYVIPNGCQSYGTPPPGAPGGPLIPPPSQVTAESVGLLAAVRVEVPVESVFVAFDAELSATKDVDQSVPGAAIGGRLVLTFALRDHVRRRGPRQFEPRLHYR